MNEFVKLYKFFNFWIVSSVIEKVIKRISVFIDMKVLEIKNWNVNDSRVVIEKIVIIGV